MSEAEGRTRPGRKFRAAGAVAAVLALVVAGLHVYRNTDVLTADELCGGLVSTAKAAAVLPGSGRLDGKGGGPAGDLKDTACEVERTSLVLGSGPGVVSLQAWEDHGGSPFVDGGWPDPSGSSFFSGPVTGGADESGGWVLLPEKCWTAKPLFLRGHSSEPVSRTAAFADLLTDAARSMAARAGCGDLPEEPGPLLPPRSEEARPVSEGRVCGLEGFSVRGQVPAGVRVLETGQTAPADLWSCTLFLDDYSPEAVRREGFTTYAASRDPLLIAAVRKSPGTSEGEAPDGREAEDAKKARIVLPCAQGALYLAADPGAQYVKARRSRSGIPEWDTNFESFVKSAAEAFDCATATN